MNNRERFHAAVRGEPVDHPPVVAWCNLVTDAVDGEENARRQMRFYETFRWDFCKVMNDYRFVPPPGLETIATAADMLKFVRQPMTDRIFAEQLTCLRIMRDRIPADIPLVDTLFEPFFSVLFAVGFSRAAFIRSHPVEAGTMLNAITDTLIDYISEVREIGVDGMLYATNACILQPSSRGITDDEFHQFHEPYDRRLLDAMQGIIRIVHAHGNPLDLSRIMDYPFEVLSWSDRLAGNASLGDVRRTTGKCLMGGIDESRLHERSLPEIRAEVADAVAQNGGPRNLILSPGCNIAPGTARRNLECLRDAAHAAVSS